MRVLSLLVLLVSLASSCPQTKPNILFILADDYGYYDIGYHGDDIQTPVLDSLASSGVKLENYYVQPICTPTRSQLFSGRYQIHTGLQHFVIGADQPHALPPGPTLANKMKEAGYATHAVGKWHLGHYNNISIPTSRGFDSFYGILTGESDYYSHVTCTRRPLPIRLCGFDFRNNTDPVRNIDGQYNTFLYVDRVKEILNQHDADKPLFLYLALQQPHIPLQVPEKYKIPYAYMTDEKRKTYAGQVSLMDEAIGNVTDMFKAKGIWKNTITIFSSDNGGLYTSGASNWPLRGGKGTYFEGGIKANSFVHGNALKTTGIVKELIHVSDWFPTLVGLASGNLTGLSLDGYDQWRTISDGCPSPRDDILININPLVTKGTSKSSIFNTSITAALRKGDWKIITGKAAILSGRGDRRAPPHLSEQTVKDTDGEDKNVWLFNLADDPYEEYDLSDKRPGKVDAMLKCLADYEATAVTPVFPPRDPLADPSLRDGFWGPWQ